MTGATSSLTPPSQQPSSTGSSTTASPSPSTATATGSAPTKPAPKPSPNEDPTSLHPPGRVRNFAERHWGISVSGSTADRGRYHGDELARGWYIRCGLRLGRSRLELETQLSRLLGVATVLITSLIEGPGHWLLPSARPRRAIQRLLTPDSVRHLVEMGVV